MQSPVWSADPDNICILRTPRRNWQAEQARKDYSYSMNTPLSRRSILLTCLTVHLKDNTNLVEIVARSLAQCPKK